MYLRPVFTETETGRIVALIEANPFGVLVTDAGGMDASHIPFVVTRHGDSFVLTAHLARQPAVGTSGRRTGTGDLQRPARLHLAGLV